MLDDWDIQTVVFSGHAIRQMFARHISSDEVTTVLRTGDTVANYPDDAPYPSRLLSARVGNRHIHVVVGYNGDTAEGVVITAYEPNIQLWDADFKTRKPR